MTMYCFLIPFCLANRNVCNEYIGTGPITPPRFVCVAFSLFSIFQLPPFRMAAAPGLQERP